MIKSKGNMYDWVDYTWNPIKGKCEHDCSYCYMKKFGKQNPIHLDKKELKKDYCKISTPIYSEHGIEIYNGDCRTTMLALCPTIVITDPPYNIGYDYDVHIDKMEDWEYIELLQTFERCRAVFIHYPEEMIQYVCAAMGVPLEVVAWIYNANTPRQHRMIAWFNCKPNFAKIKQPYKNLSDKRILELIKNGSEGANIYDWWNVEQVKNVNKEKMAHPCQIPEEIYRRIILTTTTEDDIILDPFMGSGTCLKVARDLGRKAIGIELSSYYCKLAIDRLNQTETLFMTNEVR